ncbi:uncharacterized protein [Nicotiana tomentosiformis]|uniref:uncharacterized protein n=1 Tax=Nicotiana tomentosiformis TaxID=4098 RepID=UPI00388CB75A
MDFTGEELYTVPIWVKLPGLDFKYWGPKVLSKIGSMIGKPLMDDKNTEKKIDLNCARLLIEVYANSPLSDKYDHSEEEYRRKKQPNPPKQHNEVQKAITHIKDHTGAMQTDSTSMQTDSTSYAEKKRKKKNGTDNAANEVKQAIISIVVNKSPGPDGYGSEFYREARSIIGNDVTKAILEFLENELMGRAMVILKGEEDLGKGIPFSPTICNGYGVSLKGPQQDE